MENLKKGLEEAKEEQKAHEMVKQFLDELEKLSKKYHVYIALNGKQPNEITGCLYSYIGKPRDHQWFASPYGYYEGYAEIDEDGIKIIEHRYGGK